MAVCVESRSIGLCWCRNVVAFMIVSSFLINFSTGELQSNNDSEGCRQDRGEGSCAGGSLTGADGSRQQDLSSQTSSSHHAAGKESIPDVEWSRPSAGACPADHLVSSAPCVDLPANCLSCRFNRSCVYGSDVIVLCQPATSTKCSGNRLFNRTMRCAYCYQTPSWQHDCSLCNVMMRGKKYYRANCTVQEDVLCMGRRTFHKSLFCKWTKGDRWSTALTLSIILGGFGVDRFYLGHWQEGIGKFFSFGGLGVWTLIDVVLIAIGYLSPADGSLYIT